MQINDENVKLVLSQNVKMSRLALGYTQENVAESSDISVNFLKDIELIFVNLLKVHLTNF